MKTYPSASWSSSQVPVTAVLGLFLSFLALLGAYHGIPSRNYQAERNFMELVGQGWVPLFEREKIDINHIPRLDYATLIDISSFYIGRHLRNMHRKQ